MTGPGQIDVDPGDLWSHGLRSQNRATDYYHTNPGVADDGWPSQRAYADAHDSMAGAGRAFGDRQDERGRAVGAAADGFTGQDEGASKLLQGVGSLLGPAMQALAALGQGFYQGLAQFGSAGAQALSGLFTAGSTLASQGLPKGVQMGASLGVGGNAGGSSGGGAPVAPPLGATLPPTDVAGHTTPPKDGRPQGRDGELVVQPVAGVGGMGMGGMPMARSADSQGKHRAPPTYQVVTEDDPPTQPIPVVMEPVQAHIKEA